ncbi:FAD-binding monooxygenase [Xanthomonas campestris pv. passiflorae]|uniref:FAD-binding monooxygenase n=1 Tax=Xanthomonas campestris TaxID=339 RepID=UPI00242395A0|nr:FAD-binding monooxygenase [Xanthomonas campestris]MBV6812421.1 FAD-binding monooxygenase [Xanthomonas campestris pv. passiflorae]
MADSLPADIIQAIAISNAKSIGEQPAVLANLALAQQIFNQNMQQQISLSQQQAMNQVQMAAAAKCVAMIERTSECKNQQSIDQMVKDIEKLIKDMGAIQTQRDAFP